MPSLPSPPLDLEATTTYTPPATRVAGAFIGAVLGGKYEVTGVLGVGGMGVVCEARHRELGGKRFAVKLMQRFFAGSELASARFRREVRALAAVENEHIVQITDVGVDAEHGLYMVMELLHGEDLASYLARSGRMRTADALRVALQVARALGAAHAAGILHRDLKPGNVFLVRRDDDAPFVKLFDFGISKNLANIDGEGASGTWSADLTGVGMPVGTPQYMSPEQAQGVSDVDGRTDVWALGAVLFEMLAGRSPFVPKGRAHHTLMRVMTEAPPRIEQVAPWVPPAVARVVNAALSRDRERRIPDCKAFAELLEMALGVAPSGARELVRPRTDREVTVVTPLPQMHAPIDTSIEIEVSVPGGQMRPMLLTTPLQESFYPSDPRPPAAPPSHVRMSNKDIALEETVLFELPPTPTLPPTFVAPAGAPRSRGRGLFATFVVSMVLAAAAFGGAHALRGRLPSSFHTYAAAPAR